MSQKQIKNFTISDGSRLLQYHFLENPAPIFLEASGEPGRFRITLKAGEYGHMGDASGIGNFQLDLMDGEYIAGIVESSDPLSMPDGIHTPETLIVTLRVGLDQEK